MSGILLIHYSVPGHFRSRHHKHGVNRSRKHSDNATQRRHHAATTTAVSEPLKTEAQVSRKYVCARRNCEYGAFQNLTEKPNNFA